MGIYDRILITGGGGMLAQAIARSLSQRGIACHAVTRAECDLTDEKGVGSLFQRLAPSLIINCAAYTKVDLAEREEPHAASVNGTGLATLARLASEYRAKLVHFSTDYVFDGTLSRPLLPDDPIGPQSAYGRSKLLGEEALQRCTGLAYLLIRTAWLYGPGGPCFPQTIVNVARQGKPLTVVNDQIGSPTYTRDLADATLRLIDAGARGIYHVVNSGQTTWYDFAVEILREFDLKTEIKPISSAEWKKQRPDSAARPAYSVLDTSKYTQTTGHTMRDWREALRDYRDAVVRGA